MEYIIAACSGRRIDVKQGQTITVIDTDGGQVVDFFAEVAGRPSEFLSTGVTIDCNESLRLRIGDTIYTNLYRPMMKVIADDVGSTICCIPAAARRCTISSITTARGIRTAWTTSTARWASIGPSSRR